MRRYYLLIVILGLSYMANSQTFTLKGTVSDDLGMPLPGATIVLNPSHFGQATDANGNFVFSSMPKGDYTLEITYIGYVAYKQLLTINKSMDMHITLFPVRQTLQEVVVTGHLTDPAHKENSLTVDVANTAFLKQHMGGDLMKTLDRLPGVDAMSIGSGQSKPAIRGLGFNRVVVVEHGIKHESQQWGSDHGLEIDQYAIERVEIVKGPASLMYGSDAIGGVIDLKQSKIPEPCTAGGNVDLTANSNNDLIGGSLFAYVRKNRFYFTMRASVADYADYKVPADSIDIYSFKAALHNRRLRNTAGEEQNIHFSVGFVEKHFTNRIFMSVLNNKQGFFANAHGLEPRRVDTDLHDAASRDIHFPYQEVRHIKIVNKSDIFRENYQWSAEVGYQQNLRQEWSNYVNHGYMPAVFPDTLPFDADLERAFDKYVLSGNTKISLRPFQNVESIFGLSAEYQSNTIDGRGFIIPAFKQFSSGVFTYWNYRLPNNAVLQAGLRYDAGFLHTDAYYDWFESPKGEGSDEKIFVQRASELDRSFSNISWSVGYVATLRDFDFKVNLGKSFRMPIAKELAANGVNYHHFSYEKGNADLSPEVAYQIDFGLEWQSEKLAIGLTPFGTYFVNYIYLNPGFEHDRLYGNGNQIFTYSQSEVLRYGGELHAHYAISSVLRLGIIGDYVYSLQTSGDKKGFALPFSPPASLLLNARFEPQGTKTFVNPYLSMDFRLVGNQNAIVPPEEKTSGYQTVNLALGTQINWNKQSFNVALQIQNLLNAKYFNHTSYYRLINVPEPGRSFVLNITIPFNKSLNN
ncbi:MAG: iron complex outermembrane recepter protein [Bacteroidetes bacterium]|nr:MAG: iron complex outermembrane recepter protein [Bacteroidota bacterium]